MTGAQLPLYVMLHVIVMMSFSCTAPDAEQEQLGLSAKSDASSWSCNMCNNVKLARNIEIR